MGLREIYCLRSDLEESGFNFWRLDVQGRTFVETLKADGINAVDFAHCLLEPFVQKHPESGYLKNYDFSMKIFKTCGGSREHWNFLGWHKFVKLRSPRNAHLPYTPYDGESLLSMPDNMNDPKVYEDFRDFGDSQGRNWLHIAAQGVFEHDCPKCELCRQCSFNASRLGLVKELLKANIEVGHHDDSGETPLMVHVRSLPSNDAIINELLRYGAHPDARNRKGESALHVSLKVGNIGATKALLRRGANVHARNKKGESLLSVAERAQRLAKNDLGLYARITACIALAVDAGAIAAPDLFLEWDVRR